MRGDAQLVLDTSLFKGLMQKLAAKAGMTFLDLSGTIYADPPSEDIFYISDGHWSSFAHYRAGVAISQEIPRRVVPPH
jgi:hypothetical protein